MKIITSAQLKEWDKYTMEHEPVASIDLMERAADALATAIMREWDATYRVVVMAGPGNNGGDALAVARRLSKAGYAVEVYLFNTRGKLSGECAAELERLRECGSVYFTEVSTQFDPPSLTERHLVVDGLFGSGLKGPLSGGFAAVARYLNASPAQVAAIDIPSGLMGEDNTCNQRQHVVRADVTFSIQLPKLSFLFPENAGKVGRWELLDIGLSRDFLEAAPSPYLVTEESDVRRLVRRRPRFAHKGTFGHALLVAGSYGMAGASVLAARACLRSGAGLLTVHAPVCNRVVLQSSVPEALVETDVHERYFAGPTDTDRYQAVAIGPGLGQEEDTALALREQIGKCTAPLVLDADALNILSSHRGWMSRIPRRSILTPHVRELERLTGRTADGYERLSKARELAAYLQSYVVVKGAWTAVVTPEGDCRFNPTGNPGMATGGSGDVLTGILAALLAQGYAPEDACVLGTYVHGLAGDLAAGTLGETSLVAGDIVDALPRAWKRLTENPTNHNA